MVVFTKVLKMSDSLIGAISSLSKVGGSIIAAAALEVWQFCIAPVVEMIHSSTMTSTRSIASKLVAVDELGKIYSLFGAVEAFSPLIFAPMYTQLYSTYLDTFPEVIFVLTACTTLVATSVFWLELDSLKWLIIVLKL